MAATTIEKRLDSLEKICLATNEALESLAISVKEGFDQMVTKDEFHQAMDGVNRRLDVIENISIGGHERRIENLEDRVRVIETKAKIRGK